MSPPEDLSGFSMLELFQAEVETHAYALDEGLVALEADPTRTEGIAEIWNLDVPYGDPNNDPGIQGES